MLAASMTRASTSRRGRACKQSARSWALRSSTSSPPTPRTTPRTSSSSPTHGYDVIVTSGFAYGAETIEAAKKWPNIKFIGVDQFQAEALPNLAGVIFDEDKSGFLAGALAACMTKSKVRSAPFWAPMLSRRWSSSARAIENGAKYVEPDVKVTMAYHPGGLAKGFTDPDWGASTAKAMIEQQKADVIFGAGGCTGNGALLYCAKPEVNVMAIGVDTDQYLTAGRRTEGSALQRHEADHAPA